MAQKALLFNDKEIYDIIMNSTDQKNIKKLGRLVKNYDESIWNSNRENIMETGLYFKFSQNKNIGQILINTGDKYIAECAPRDKIWGIGYGVNSALNNKEKWGQNLLGKTLMLVRHRLSTLNK
jgi:hypothetical protein